MKCLFSWFMRLMKMVSFAIYVSAGIEDKHVPDAVVAGVDGIGIGN